MTVSKLADWDDDDPSTLHDTSSKWDKVVILKHLFTLEELEVRPAHLILWLIFRELPPMSKNPLVNHPIFPPPNPYSAICPAQPNPILS